MSISVQCTCGAKLKAKDTLAGKKVACPKCKQPLVIAPPASPEAEPLDPQATGADQDGGRGLPADANFGDGLGLPPIDSTAADGDPLGLGDLSDLDPSAFGDGSASPLGEPTALPSLPNKQSCTAPAKDNRMLLIAAIGGGATLLLILVGGLIAWLAWSGEPEVAENPSPTNERSAAPTDQASAPNPKDRATPAKKQPKGKKERGTPQNAGANVETPTEQDLRDEPSTTGEPADDTPADDPGQPPENPRVEPAPPDDPTNIRDDNALKMKFCLCPAGRTPYGQEESYAEFPEDFWLGQTEVTRGQWTRVMKTTPWTKYKVKSTGDNYPASAFSWHDAMAFCKRITEVERAQGRLSDDLEYRLPTEAEWFYASSAPRLTESGDAIKLTDYAWYASNSDGRKREVGTLQPNAWGFYDMLGNVTEWTLDRFADADQVRLSVYGGPNPFQWNDIPEGAEQLNMARGGYYNDRIVAAKHRISGRPATLEAGGTGLRVALARPAVPTQPPGPSSDRVWFVLSGLQARPAGNSLQVSVDWELVQGRIDPASRYRVFVFAKVISKSYLSSVHTIEAELNDQQGTVEGKIPARSANGQHTVSIAVIGKEEGHGSRMLASGELEIQQRSSAPKPPAR